MRCPACSSHVDGTSRSCPRCGVRLFSLAAGVLFDERYLIERGLGRGGMGEVYQAHDRELEETVAIKLLRPDLTDSPDALRRFRAEARLARRVRHKNVCAIHDFGRCGDVCYLTMEYVDGIDLHADLRAKGRLSATEALDATLQTAAALEAIHELGIVHRDLKTANLMRDAQGLIRLRDFGIATRPGEEHGVSLTGTGMVVGTPEYMSPEQLRGEAVDARTDLYSLGVVLFELLTGDVPFRATTPLATALKQLQEPPPLTGRPGRPLPPETVPVLRTALAKDRAERYPDVGAMAAALRAAQTETRERDTEPTLVLALPPSAPPAAPSSPARPTPPAEPDFEVELTPREEPATGPLDEFEDDLEAPPAAPSPSTPPERPSSAKTKDEKPDFDVEY
jgi:serine/threonine protein kinase